MRKFTVFMSLYLLALTLLPCGDAFAHKDATSTKEKIEQTANEHTDVCSSLCSCACCGQITYNEATLIFSFDIKTNFKELIPYYKENVTQKFSDIVWQPPKN